MSDNIHISNSTIIRVILFALLIIVIWQLKSLVLILLTSIVIASFVESGVRRFKVHGMGRVFSVVIIYVVLILFLSGLFYLIVPTLVKEMSSFYDSFKNVIPSSEMIDKIADAPTANMASKFDALSSSELAQIVEKFSSKASSGFLSTVSSIFGGIANFFLIFVLSFFLSIEEKGIEKFLKIVTPLRHEEYVVSLWNRTQRKISRWIQGQMLLGVIVGFLTFVFLSLMGVPYALLLALIVAIFELVPYGMIIAVIPSVLIAYLGGSITTAFWTLIFFVALQQVENLVLSPLIVRKATGLSPIVVILSLLAGATLAGFWGVILAMPMAVFLMELLRDVEAKKVTLKD